MMVRYAAVVSLMLLVTISPISAGGNKVPPMEMVVEPAERFTTNWVIVMDASHSMRGVFDRAFDAYLEVTRFPTDELYFALVTFNNRGMEQFRDWVPASAAEFGEASRLVERETNRGVLSWGGKAIRMAIQQERPELTVIIISDGGFTEACEGRGFGSMRELIRSSQQWRLDHGLPEALICCIGVENPGYTNGHKPPDAECQAFLREIGSQYRGGYFLMRKIIRRVS